MRQSVLDAGRCPESGARTAPGTTGSASARAEHGCGRRLARESGLKADIVIGVPDSGTTAAIGFAAESGVPFAEGLIKNRYIGRTFIQPEQQKRDTGVRIKLNANRAVVAGKSVIMVDDSIVRGTTSGKIFKMLKDAGATAVHMCVSSPPIGYPCYYGIDTSARKELIAANSPVEGNRRFIGADSLYYLPIEGLQGAVANIEYDRMCYACFNCDYPCSVPCDSEISNKYVFEAAASRKKSGGEG